MALETETKYFDSRRADWIKAGHHSDWVVVKGESLLGFYSTIEEAYEAAADAYGTESEFLLKQLLPEDPVETIQRVDWGARARENAV